MASFERGEVEVVADVKIRFDDPHHKKRAGAGDEHVAAVRLGSRGGDLRTRREVVERSAPLDGIVAVGLDKRRGARPINRATSRDGDTLAERGREVGKSCG